MLEYVFFFEERMTEINKFFLIHYVERKINLKKPTSSKKADACVFRNALEIVTITVK